MPQTPVCRRQHDNSGAGGLAAGRSPLEYGLQPEAEKQQEVEMARALMQGDGTDFENFVEHFRTKIFRYTWLMCGQREDAEEVSQETMLKVFQKFDQLDTPEHVRPWIFRIARNECLMKRRRSTFAPETEISLDSLLPVRREIADWSSLPDHEMLQGELREQIARGIRELPETYRTVVLLRDMEQLSTEATAEILGLTTDVVKTRLHRGRLALRKSLDAYLTVRRPG
jgi:RNA polymerase sigma-70 factor (ECF subfamily)